MKYKKKNPFVEAFKYEGKIRDEDDNYCIPQWAVNGVKEGALDFCGGELVIFHEYGEWQFIPVGCYVVKNDYGKFECWSAQLFEKYHEVAE